MLTKFSLDVKSYHSMKKYGLTLLATHVLAERSGSASLTSSFFVEGERDLTGNTQEAVARGTTLAVTLQL